MPVIAPLAPQLTKPWNDRGVDADHQRDLVVAAGDVLGGIAQVVGAAELLEADEVPVLGAQREEQVGAGCEAVIGAVVDDGGQVGRGRQDRLEMRLLGGDDRSRATGRAG